jgi:hypothetical protein
MDAWRPAHQPGVIVGRVPVVQREPLFDGGAQRADHTGSCGVVSEPCRIGGAAKFIGVVVRDLRLASVAPEAS